MNRSLWRSSGSSSDGRIAGLIPVSCSHVLAYSDEIMKPKPSLAKPSALMYRMCGARCYCKALGSSAWMFHIFKWWIWCINTLSHNVKPCGEGVGGGQSDAPSPHFPAAALGGAQSSLYKLKILMLQIHFLSSCLFSSNKFNTVILKNANISFKI